MLFHLFEDSNFSFCVDVRLNPYSSLYARQLDSETKKSAEIGPDSHVDPHEDKRYVAYMLYNVHGRFDFVVHGAGIRSLVARETASQVLDGSLNFHLCLT